MSDVVRRVPMSDAEWAQVSLLLVGSYGARVSEVGIATIGGLLMEDFPDATRDEVLAVVKGHVRVSVHPPTYAEIRTAMVESRRVAQRAAALERRLESDPEFRRGYEARSAAEAGDVDGYLAALGVEEPVSGKFVEALRRRAEEGSVFAAAALQSRRFGAAEAALAARVDVDARAAQVDAEEAARVARFGKGPADA